jgi:hypothetical protein
VGQQRPRRGGLPRRLDSPCCAVPRSLNPGPDGSEAACRLW